MNKEDLKEVLRLHKMYLKDEEGGKRANLTGADLIGADLSYADLRRADLEGADLRRADLRDAYLRYVDLRRADLRRADLRRADLEDADLQNADLAGADLRCADLQNADLAGADLRCADLQNADLAGADLRYADLRYVDLRRAYLRNADLPKELHILTNEEYHIQIFKDNVRAGCECHSVEEWLSFTQDQIETMDGKRALEFYPRLVKLIKEYCEDYITVKEEGKSTTNSPTVRAMYIASNQVRCLSCEDIIYSSSHHDFVKCSCGDVSVDGGQEYLKRSYSTEKDAKGYEELSIMVEKEAMNKLTESVTWAMENNRNALGIALAVLRAFRDNGIVQEGADWVFKGKDATSV